MMIRELFAICMFGLITLAHAQLYCYVCENCPDGNALTEDMLMSCSGEETTSLPTSTTTTSNTPTETEPTTTNPTTLTSPTTTNPTNPTTTSTDPPPITSDTEASTESTTPTSNTPPTVSTDPPTDLPSDPSTNPTVPTSDQTPNTSSNTPPGAPIETTSDEPGTETEISTNETTTPTVPASPPTTTSQSPGSPPPSMANAFVRGVGLKQTSFNCYVIIRQVGNREQVDRGCVTASPNHNEMYIKANDGDSPEGCQICAAMACNNATHNMGSGIIVPVILILLFSIFAVISV